ncbi:MAG: AmmeMemoRadiSam system radical SAM enzyme [Candidatus Altiarchaeales archaeon ex4484_2]|nr:MAG: AmmeMemoRadiSam system radical SAM enzyme [Candidatus Altiarchaeales archaeon ex4484_2]
MKEAMLYTKKKEGVVNCFLCNHRCVIPPGGRGVCGVRENREGILYSLVYGKAIAAHVDPIEKKPLNHFLPGSLSYSIATIGCNFRCQFCQNWNISQKEGGEIRGRELKPDEIVRSALKNNCKTISYTYTEPTIFFEYAYDTGTLAREKGLRNVFVSNGFMTPECLDKAGDFLDAANIDLKSFRDSFYKKVCSARVDPVLESIKKIKRKGIWLELTTLLIPERNDSVEELRDIANFIAGEVGEDTPWHISRFHPAYKFNDYYPTPVETIHRAREIGLEAGLKYVYVGNVSGDLGEDTLCSRCGMVLVDRSGFTVSRNRINEGKCPNCGLKIEGVWE